LLCPISHAQNKAVNAIFRLIIAVAAAVAAGAAGAAAPDVGRDIAANCASCHGTDGRSRGGMPSLAGRDKVFIVERVREFRDGRRPSTVMQQLAKGYSDAQIEAAAAYFSTRKSD